ncbi:hypothetical protein, variant 1 [Aphanomyces invadans]|uniref:F-box/LRR-repeat protein 15-like leucin rich repeat domain-containing protein n=1 Tax=Aphanomyces invadans TaxID=157072 RepID=A0A024USC0_9STRA|nr:hypothetical protein, variant 1 [Aphanomyces invadans]ETW09244.1 hypothetical protein, variant 1 [Aphanomyces invadans]|eukprot:XP_008863049.1 hypothetical protein, variant 1 [Aphanomyces invadans]
MAPPLKSKRTKAATGVPAKTLASWMERLVQRQKARKDYLCHLRDTDLTIGAPVAFGDKVRRAVDLAGGAVALTESPPPHLSFKDCLRKHPCTHVNLSELDVNAWMPTLVARTIPPGVPVKPSVCDSLHLRHSIVNDGAIKHIGNLKFVQILDISGCDLLTDVSLHVIRRSLSQLSALYINDCRNFSSDALVATWTDCTRLRRLYARNCPGVTDRVLLCIATTKRAPEFQVQVVDVQRCRHVTDSGVGDLAHSKQDLELTYLGLGHCPHVKTMAFFSFEASRSLAHLDTLDMVALDIDETAISWLTTGCSATLTKLNLAHCHKLNDFCLALLGRCRKLLWLSLKGCAHVTSAGLRDLVQPQGAPLSATTRKQRDDSDVDSSLLTYLNLKNCVRVDDTAMAELAQACLDLEVLNLRGVPHVTDIGLTALAKRCTILRSLKVSGCRNPAFYGRPDVGDHGLRALSKLCRHLTVLDLAGAPRVTTLGIAAIAATCSNLEKITLTDTPVDDVAVLALSAHCPALHTLHLSKCRHLTDVAIEAIASGLFNLRVLSLAWISNLTNKSLVALAATKSPIETLDLTGDCQIDDDGLSALVAGCHRLRHVVVKGCDRLTTGCLRDSALKLPFCRPQLCPDAQVLEPQSPAWIAIYEHLVEQYMAACTLQACARKWKQRDASFRVMARRKLRRQRRAATKIQRCYRCHHQWLAFLRMLSLGRNVKVIVHVQAVYRGNKSRIASRSWKALATSSANIIQRAAKRHLYRRHTHARDIQRVYRGYRGRVVVMEMVQARRDAAGIRLVAWARRCFARYEFHQRARVISAHVRRIQRVYRSYSRRERLRNLVKAVIANATRIQSVMRMVLAKAKVACHRARCHASSLRIQTVYRGYRTRRWFRHYKTHVVGATIRIQAWVRRNWHRRAYLHTRKCIIAAQRRFRTYLSIRDMHIMILRALHARRWAAAELIQRVYRGHLGRRRATLFRKIQRAKFARKGQNAAEFFVRRRFLRRGAAIRVQRWIRPVLQRMRMTSIHAWRTRQAKLCIQRYVKGWLARVLAKRAKARLVAATQDMQRVYRGHRGRQVARARWIARQRLLAAIFVQKFVRGFLARCYRRRYFAEATAAAIKMQKVYRGNQGRRVAAIERANRTLAARDKYRASLRGKLDLKLDMRERKFFLQRQIAVMEVSHKQLKRRRMGYEKKMEDVRANRAAVWARANEVVHETYSLKRSEQPHFALQSSHHEMPTRLTARASL